MSPASPRLALLLDLFRRYVDDRSIAVAAKSLAQFDGISPIALLVRAQRLVSDLVGIHDQGLQPHLAQPARDEERHGPAFERDACTRFELVLVAQGQESLQRRGHAAFADDLAQLILDHVNTLLAVSVESHVTCH